MTTKITEKNISNVANFAVDWQTVVTADGSTNTTAVAGKGYFIDTTSAAHTIVLPASPSFGDTITIADYATTFATNNVTINPNGNKIEANTANGVLETNDQTHTLVFTDSTQGWKIINQDTASDIQPSYISATGGTITTSGDYKIHTFTGDGCFVVSSLGNPSGGGSNVDYLVVAGGGGGATVRGAGGGAGGYRESKDSTLSSPHTASPLAATTGITVSATTYPVTVGAGGVGGTSAGSATCMTTAGSGSNSVFSTITSTGGGRGEGANGTPSSGGGSGGGGLHGPATGTTPGSAGNTPPVNPPQGNSGGSGVGGDAYGAGGGGGATTAGTNGNPTTGGPGGNGATSSINGTPTTRAGGGGGSIFCTPAPAAGDGGTGGGGDAGGPSESGGIAGTANTGGGGGGGYHPGPGVEEGGGAGGKGIVIIRYKFQ